MKNLKIPIALVLLALATCAFATRSKVSIVKCVVLSLEAPG